MEGIASNQITKDNLKLNPGDLSGDLIKGGTISEFASSGISDHTTRRIMVLEDQRMILDAGLTIFDGTRKPIFEIDNNSIRLHRPLITDVQIENKITNTPTLGLTLDNISGSGLMVKDKLNVQYFLYKNNTWDLSDSLKLPQNKSINIGKRLVLNELELGPTIVKSNLKQLGVLKELRVDGEFIVGESLYYNPDTQRLGINTIDPQGVLGLMENGVEFVIRGEDFFRGKIGTATKHDLHLVVNNISVVKIDQDGYVSIGDNIKQNSKVTISHNNNMDFALTLVNTGKGLSITGGKESKLVIKDQITDSVTMIVGDGKMGVNVAEPEAALHVAGDVNLMNKHMWSAPKPPGEGRNRKGDIVWNSNPGPTQPVGWICIQDGVPGIWAVFGRIESVQ